MPGEMTTPVPRPASVRIPACQGAEASGWIACFTIPPTQHYNRDCGEQIVKHVHDLPDNLRRSFWASVHAYADIEEAVVDNPALKDDLHFVMETLIGQALALATRVVSFEHDWKPEHFNIALEGINGIRRYLMVLEGLINQEREDRDQH
jgi:hypothetical protein